MIKLDILLFGVTSLLLDYSMHKCVASTPSEFLVHDLERIEPAFESFKGEMYAGLLPIDCRKPGESIRGKLMFWLFEPKESILSHDDSLIIWLNGGPGCSSFEAGMFFEHSPVTTLNRTDEHAPFAPNPYSWTNAAPVLYVEQPAGTGFSYGPEPVNEDDVARDFYYFLLNFYDTFKHLAPKRLFIFGESYAGMYIPSMARRIYLENENAKNQRINLAGIALGNGVVDTMIQGPAVIDYAWWHSMIDYQTRDVLHEFWKKCEAGTIGEDTPHLHSFTVPDECGIMGAVLAAAGDGLFPDKRPNTYDVTTWDPWEIIYSQNATIPLFYNNPSVKLALHAPLETVWRGCIPGSGRRRRRRRRMSKSRRSMLMLDNDRPISVVPYIAELLDLANISVLIYNGDRDMSVNAPGTEEVIFNMEWSGQEEWKGADRGLWLVNDEIAGYTKAYKGLNFLVVYNSGHMVPTDHPAIGLDIVKRLLNGEGFLDRTLPGFAHSLGQKTKHDRNQATLQQIGKWTAQWVIVLLVAVVAYIAGVLSAFML